MRKEHEGAIRSEVVARVFDRRVARSQAPGGQPLAEVINESLYRERERLRQQKDSPRVAADRAFYSRVRRELPHASEAGQKKLLREILDRYGEEITGHFSPWVYRFATSAIPVALTGLLNGLSPLKLLSKSNDLPSVGKQIVVQGDVTRVKRLQKLGTTVFVPTHSSNLDSVVIGYIIFRLGMPPVIYGAGLNLFSNPIIGFFMRNLGAYTVDRLKRDPLYKEALKEYTTVTLEFGYHNLFFPGGTRSRSNCVETKLKRGLLGTAVAAFRHNLQNRKKNPRLFIVPCTISYPLTLEAATLINDHMRREGQSRYIIVDDEFSQLQRWVDFVKGLFSLDQRIYVTFGEPLDPFGNDVDAQGNSLDPKGRVIDPGGYLKVDGEYQADPARDAQYTIDLARRVGERYLTDNVVFPTTVLAFAFLRILRGRKPGLDYYRFLRELGPETSVSLADVERELEESMSRLREMARARRVRLCRELEGGDVGEIIRSALRSFGTYHTTAVIQRKGVRLHVGDANLIVYYANRLYGYGLTGADQSLGERRPV